MFRADTDIQVMRGGRKRRKSSAGSKCSADVEAIRTPSMGTGSISPITMDNVTEDNRQLGFGGHRLGAIDFAEDGDDENQGPSCRKGSYGRHSLSKKERKKERKRQEKEKRKRSRRNGDDTINEGIPVDSASAEKAPEATQEDVDAPRRVDFANVDTFEIPALEEGQAGDVPRRPFTLRGITGTIRPQMPKTFSQNVFMQPSASPPPAPTAGPIPRVRYGIRRTNSLPDRLNQTFTNPATRVPSTLQPIRINSSAVSAQKASKEEEDDENISRTTAVLLLLISTGLVAVCAEFMVDSINAVVEGSSGLSEAFIGLIILPIVGNAAEHVTAVTVASKNKMDLAIGVAVGSSIQIGTYSFSPPTMSQFSLDIC